MIAMLFLTFFLGAWVVPSEDFFMKSLNAWDRYSREDAYCATQAESASALVSRVAVLNQGLAVHHKACPVALIALAAGQPEVLEALKNLATIDRVAQDMTLAQLTALQLSLAVQGQVNAPGYFRGAPDLCEIPAQISWRSPVLRLGFKTEWAGFEVQENGGRVSWRYNNPRVQPMRTNTGQTYGGI